MLQYKGSVTEIVWENFQSQQGGFDCGFFAVAIGTALCSGQDPAVCQWEQTMMREHHLYSFQQENLVSFPSKERSKKGTNYSIVKRYSIFCLWHEPYFQPPAGKRMAKCSKYHEGHHEGCKKESPERYLRTHNIYFLRTSRKKQTNKQSINQFYDMQLWLLIPFNTGKCMLLYTFLLFQSY